MDWMIEVEGLVKTFGHLTAVDGVSFSVPKGEVWAFLDQMALANLQQ